MTPNFISRSSREWKKLPAALALLTLVGARSQAQPPAAIDQVNNDQQRRSMEQAAQLNFQNGDSVPDLYPGETDDVGPQSVLAVRKRRTLFEGVVDTQYYFTDNVFLDHSTRLNSGVMVSTVQFSVAPTAYALGPGESEPRIGFRQQWFDFFEYKGIDPSLANYDFNAQTAFVDEHWTYQNTWRAGVGFDYTRLLTTASYHQFYAEYTPHWDLSHLTPIGKKQVLSLGYQGYYHFSSASQFQILPNSTFFNRLDQMFVATYTIPLGDNFILQPFDTFRYTHFTSGVNRDDYLNSVGVGAYYFFNSFISARLFTSFDKRFSNITQAEYHQFDAGAGLNVTVRF